MLTLVGEDKPGIVGRVSSAVVECGANWQASRMARLAGQFAGVLEVSVPSESKGRLLTALGKLKDAGLHVVIQEADAFSPKAKRILFLELVGNDRSGIIQEISQVLTKLGVNVGELSTEREEAPMGGGKLFRFSALLECSDTVQPEHVRVALESVADDLMVETRFSEPTKSGTHRLR